MLLLRMCRHLIGFSSNMDAEVKRLNKEANLTKAFPLINAIRATREHLVRFIDGGGDDEENIVMACADLL